MGLRPTLALIRHLSHALEAKGVRYCQWKNSGELSRAARGERVLDLLVTRGDVSAVTGILGNLGFKETLAPVDRRLPGVLSFYGLDSETQQLVHVRLYRQLIVGRHPFRCYHIPIERWVLATAGPGWPLRILAPEFELVFLVLQLMLDHASWRSLVTVRWHLSAEEREQLENLRSRVDQVRFRELVERHMSAVGARLLTACLSCLEPGAQQWHPGWARARRGRTLRRRLRVYEVRGGGFAGVTGRRSAGAPSGRARDRSGGHRIAAGGAVIAIVGADGAGKSTAVEELVRWLSSDLEVTRVHFGRPVWSFSTFLIRTLLKAGGLLAAPLRWRRAGPRGETDPRASQRSLSRLVWNALRARDRYRTYAMARRRAIRGSIVLCDRYPIRQLDFMDGPQIRRLTGDSPIGMFVRFLRRREERWHDLISSPEALVVLRVPPEVAAARKKNEDSRSVLARSGRLWELSWEGTSAKVVDASRSRAEVAADLKAYLWAVL